MVVWKRLDDLLSNPLDSRISRDVEVNDATTVMPKDQEDIEHTEGYSGHGETHHPGRPDGNCCLLRQSFGRVFYGCLRPGWSFLRGQIGSADRACLGHLSDWSLPTENAFVDNSERHHPHTKFDSRRNHLITLLQFAAYQQVLARGKSLPAPSRSRLVKIDLLTHAALGFVEIEFYCHADRG